VISFTVPGEPRGKGRPRFSTHGGFPRAYTDAKTRAYESEVAFAAKVAMRGRAPLLGALSAIIVASFSIPKSYSKSKRAAILAGTVPYFGAFDADNISKSLLDSMNGVCFADDKQVMCLHIVKRAAEVPGISIELVELAA
jgi:Holliday junction resolvase RusA-like endonuclease